MMSLVLREHQRTLYCSDCVCQPQDHRRVPGVALVSSSASHPHRSQQSLPSFSSSRNHAPAERERVTPVAFCEQFKWELFKALICQSAAELRTRHYRISHSQLITEPESELTGRCRLGLGAWDKLSMTNPRTHNVQHCIVTTHIIRNNCP